MRHVAGRPAEVACLRYAVVSVVHRDGIDSELVVCENFCITCKINAN